LVAVQWQRAFQCRCECSAHSSGRLGKWCAGRCEGERQAEFELVYRVEEMRAEVSGAGLHVVGQNIHVYWQSEDLRVSVADLHNCTYTCRPPVE
jgi:hypothetical protein